MSMRLVVLGTALVLVAGCDVAQRGPGAVLPGIPESASWRQPEGSYVFNDGARRFAIELDDDWTIGSSIEKGAFALNAKRVARGADDRVTQLQARFHATTPRRELAVMTVAFDKPGMPAAAEQAKQVRAAEQAKCPEQALPEVPMARTKDGKAAYIVLRCRTAAMPASAIAMIDDPAVSPSFTIVHGAMGDYVREPVLHKEVLDDFVEVVKSYKAGG